MTSTALCVVATPGLYHDFALSLFESAEEFFHPTSKVEFVLLDGDQGWPMATMCRHDKLRLNLPDTDYVYLTDADMLCAAPIGPEILPPRVVGLVATEHPGYVGKPYSELPYEQNPESACYVPESEGTTYFCGGFWGGSRAAVRTHLSRTTMCLELDMMRSFTPSWHDESAHNRVLATFPPALTLNPSYCYPDRDAYYREQVWGDSHDFQRRLVALEKTPEQRTGR